MQNWPERLEDELFLKSRTLAAPWGPIVRALRYPAAITRDWLAGEINIRAMSLAYTTLLSLVPLLVFSFAILKGLGARSDLRYLLHQFFKPLGEAANQLTESVLQFVANMHGDVLGSIGLAFLVYTVITTIEKVEASFNFVWRVARPRGFARRFTQYLGVMIVGPILLAVAIGIFGAVAQSAPARWLDSFAVLHLTFALLAQIAPYLIVTFVFTLMYAVIPNTRVKFRAALIGGVTAGIIWALVGRAFTEVILYSSQMMAVYTGFAIVLTTLIWVYLSWLILLIGAQLAFYVQCPQYLRHGQEVLELGGSARELAGLAVMALIGRAHRAGGPYWSDAGLAAELDVPGPALAPVLDCLQRGGLIVATDRQEFVPGRAIERIRLSDIIETVRSAQKGTRLTAMRSLEGAAAVVHQLDEAIESRLGQRSLDELIDTADAATRPRSSSR